MSSGVPALLLKVSFNSAGSDRKAVCVDIEEVYVLLCQVLTVAAATCCAPVMAPGGCRGSGEGRYVLSRGSFVLVVCHRYDRPRSVGERFPPQYRITR